MCPPHSSLWMADLLRRIATMPTLRKICLRYAWQRLIMPTMTVTEARCTVCDFDGGELTCAPHRAALFALTFAVVMFATAAFLGVAVFHPGVAFAIATSVTTTAVVGVAAWRVARSYRLDLFGTECRVTINGLVGR